jgi:hypothetical protein
VTFEYLTKRASCQPKSYEKIRDTPKEGVRVPDFIKTLQIWGICVPANALRAHGPPPNWGQLVSINLLARKNFVGFLPLRLFNG